MCLSSLWKPSLVEEFYKYCEKNNIEYLKGTKNVSVIVYMDGRVIIRSINFSHSYKQGMNKNPKPLAPIEYYYKRIVRRYHNGFHSYLDVSGFESKTLKSRTLKSAINKIKREGIQDSRDRIHSVELVNVYIPIKSILNLGEQDCCHCSVSSSFTFRRPRKKKIGDGGAILNKLIKKTKYSAYRLRT